MRRLSSITDKHVNLIRALLASWNMLNQYFIKN